jgi:DNA-binding GntR family transcriptional regulator
MDESPALQRVGPEPLHEQIAERLQRQIHAGIWPVHYKLPAEPQLAGQFEVSRGTIRRALRALIEKGLLVQVQGKGTFVQGTTSIEQPIAQELLSLAEGLDRLGLEFETDLIAAGLLRPDKRVAALLSVGPDESVVRLIRRRSVGSTWVAYLLNYVRADLAAGIEKLDLKRRRLFEVLERDYGLQLAWARRTFEAQAAAGEVARRLEVAEGSPVLYLEQVTYLADDSPIEYSDVWIRGDKLKLSSLLRRLQPETEAR